MALKLRNEKDVLAVPGDCFGLEDHFRFSSALPEDYLDEGLARSEQFAQDGFFETLRTSKYWDAARGQPR